MTSETIHDRRTAAPLPPLFLRKIFIPGWLGLDHMLQNLENKGGVLTQGLHS
jgi:hypothetical protein